MMSSHSVRSNRKTERRHNDRIIIVTQPHPDPQVERYRRFALAKLSQRHTVYIAGNTDYAVPDNCPNLVQAPFLHDAISNGIDIASLQHWVAKEKIAGVYFINYDHIICELPDTIPKTDKNTFLIFQPVAAWDSAREIESCGPIFITSSALARFKHFNLVCDHWMVWEILARAMHHKLRPTLVSARVSTLHFSDKLFYGSLEAHKTRTQYIIEHTKRLGLDTTKLTGIKLRLAATNPGRQGLAALESFHREILYPLKSLLAALLPKADAKQRKRSRPLSLASIKSIGIIKLDNIGDALLMTPMLRKLRRNFKGEIRLLCSGQAYDFWLNCPWVDKLTCVNRHLITLMPTQMLGREIFSGEVKVPKGLEIETDEAFAAIAETGQPFLQDCDAILVPRSGADLYGSMNLACLTNALHRVMIHNVDGRDAKWNKGFEYNATHVVMHDTEHPHEIDSLLRILNVFDIPQQPTNRQTSYWATAEDKQALNGLYKPAAGKLQIAVAPGASDKERMWPVENYLATLKMLGEHLDFELILIGSHEDVSLAYFITAAAQMPVHNLTGRLTVPQNIHLLTLCDLLIGSDSAPVHFANAAGIPAVTISAHAKTGHPGHIMSPLRFGIFNQKSIILQPESMAGLPCIESCYAGKPHCILGVTPDMVATAALQLLKTEKGDIALRNPSKLRA